MPGMSLTIILKEERSVFSSLSIMPQPDSTHKTINIFAAILVLSKNFIFSHIHFYLPDMNILICPLYNITIFLLIQLIFAEIGILPEIQQCIFHPTTYTLAPQTVGSSIRTEQSASTTSKKGFRKGSFLSILCANITEPFFSLGRAAVIIGP